MYPSAQREFCATNLSAVGTDSPTSGGSLGCGFSPEAPWLAGCPVMERCVECLRMGSDQPPHTSARWRLLEEVSVMVHRAQRFLRANGIRPSGHVARTPPSRPRSAQWAPERPPRAARASSAPRAGPSPRSFSPTTRVRSIRQAARPTRDPHAALRREGRPRRSLPTFHLL